MNERLNHDKLDDDPAFRDRIKVAEKEAEAAVKHVKKGQRGYCHAFWSAKQRVLREKYGISWQSPADLNPRIKFD